MTTLELFKELTKRYISEIENPSKSGWNAKEETWQDNFVPNKSKLKRLRLLLHEVMREIEENDK